jgi:hypothetical protein
MRDTTGEDEILGSGAQALAELRPELVGQVEHPLHVGLGGTRPHDSGSRTSTEQEVQGMSEHRLAGARLTREHVQTRGEPQLGGLYEQQVLDT